MKNKFQLEREVKEWKNKFKLAETLTDRGRNRRSPRLFFLHFENYYPITALPCILSGIITFLI